MLNFHSVCPSPRPPIPFLWDADIWKEIIFLESVLPQTESAIYNTYHLAFTRLNSYFILIPWIFEGRYHALPIPFQFLQLSKEPPERTAHPAYHQLLDVTTGVWHCPPIGLRTVLTQPNVECALTILWLWTWHSSILGFNYLTFPQTLHYLDISIMNECIETQIKRAWAFKGQQRGFYMNKKNSWFILISLKSKKWNR